MKKFRYSRKSKEIHRVSKLTRMCHAGTADRMPSGSHWGQCGWFKVFWLLAFKRYDFCGHCYPELSQK